MATADFGFQYVVVADDTSPDQAQFAPDQSKATMVIDVDASYYDLELIVSDLLGYPIRDGTRTSKLSRYTPWNHPEFPWLYATQITSIQGRQFRDKHKYRGGYHARYNYYRISILFETPTYSIMDDNDVGNAAGCEFKRYVTEKCKGGSEILQRRGANYRWVKAGGTTLPTGIDASTPLDIGITLRVPKVNIEWTWHQVPRVGLFGSTGEGVPAIFSGKDKVNSATFQGYAAGTLLCTDIELIPKAAPIYPSGDIGGRAPKPPRLYDVIYRVTYFDPPYNPNYDGLGTAYPLRGHRLVPLPPTANPTSDRYWYAPTLDTSGNSANEEYLLYGTSFDYNNFFTLS